MNKEEYEQKKQELAQEEPKVTTDVIKNTPPTNNFEDDDITQMIQASKYLITEEQKEKTIKEDEQKQKKDLLQTFGGNTLSQVPELADFLQSEDHLVLGTQAKIPVPLEIMGHPVKVYIRPLSRKELIECRNRAKAKGHTDIDYEAILMTCSKQDGTLYTEEEINQLGYGHTQIIGEAIMIASGESPENTQNALKKHLVDEFLEKFTSKASW